MKHLGDITKISGYTAPVVDCIIGGSPCQDLSVAGKRAGLDGERSGLYIEQVRIVKEMRAQDVRYGRTGVDIRPRYMVWENVPGAFSSNKGEDFRIVLEELAKVCDENAVIPRPADGKWRTSGCIMGRGYSIAWRVLDAQFWGVPQRRRRIALVADFGGQSAPEILFVTESLSWHNEQGEQKGEEASRNASAGVGAADCYTVDQGGGKSGVDVREDKAPTLTTTHDGAPAVIYALDRASFNQGKNAQYDFEVSTNGASSPLVAKGPSAVCYSVENHQQTIALEGNGSRPSHLGDGYAVSDKSYTLNTKEVHAVCYGINGDVAGTLDASYYKGCGERQGIEREVVAVDCRNATEDVINGALQRNSAHSLNGNNVVRHRYIVRRLTPLECERLQGYPDGWTLIGESEEVDVADYICEFDESKYIKPNYEDFGLTWDDINEFSQIDEDELVDDEEFPDYEKYLKYLDECEKARTKATKKVRVGTHKETRYFYTDSNGKKRQTFDAARYKALGNSIALPPWKWVLKRLCACYERDATMASLFDGIGGFPYLWEQLNGKGTCLWASEIEEFPMAVTKVRIGE